MLGVFIIVIRCIFNTMLGSVLFPGHFHVLYIRKLQLKKIYGIYDTTDNNNRANRYANYVKYNINDNNSRYNKGIINNICVLFGRYGIFDRSVSFCQFQFPPLNFGLRTKSTLLLPLRLDSCFSSLNIFQEDLDIEFVVFVLVPKIQR